VSVNPDSCMSKELADQLVKEVKEKVPKVDLAVEEIVLITTTALCTMAKFSAREAEHNRVRFLRGAADLVRKIFPRPATQVKEG
jgi:hypothetical protein